VPPRFFKFTYIRGASGSTKSKRRFVTVQGAVATFWEPRGWVEDEVRQKVDARYAAAFALWSRHAYGVVEIDGHETEEIEAHEAPGFYILCISENDVLVERWRLSHAGAVEMPVVPAVKGGFGRVIDFLAEAVDLFRGLVGF